MKVLSLIIASLPVALISAPLLAQQPIPVSNLLLKNGTASPTLVLGSGASKVTLSAGTGGVLKVDGIALGTGTGGGVGGTASSMPVTGLTGTGTGVITALQHSVGSASGIVALNTLGNLVVTGDITANSNLRVHGPAATLHIQEVDGDASNRIKIKGPNTFTGNYNQFLQDATGTIALVNQSTTGSAGSVPLAGITGIGAGGTAALALATNTSGGLVTFSGHVGAATATSINGLQLSHGLNGNAISVAVGDDALKSTTSGSRNTAVGVQALRDTTSGVGNVMIGGAAGRGIASGLHNTGVGDFVMFNASGGISYNSAFGYQSMINSVSGDLNAAFGYQSLLSNSAGASNTAFGGQALYSVLGSGNIGLGSGAGYYETGSNYLYIDNQTRANVSAERANAIIHGEMTATGSTQILSLNAGTLKFPYLPTSNNGFVWNNGGVLITGTPGTPTLNISGNATTSTTSGTASAALTLANGTATLTPPTVVGSTGQVLTLLTTGGQTSWQSVAAGGTASSGSVLAPAITSSSLLSFGTGASLALGTSGIITDGGVGTITGSSGQLTITNGYIFQGTAASLKLTGGQILEGYGFTNNGNISNAGIISGGTLSPAVFGLGTTNNITLVGTMSGGTASGRHIATSTANGLVLTGTTSNLGVISGGTWSGGAIGSGTTMLTGTISGSLAGFSVVGSNGSVNIANGTGGVIPGAGSSYRLGSDGSNYNVLTFYEGNAASVWSSLGLCFTGTYGIWFSPSGILNRDVNITRSSAGVLQVGATAAGTGGGMVMTTGTIGGVTITGTGGQSAIVHTGTSARFNSGGFTMTGTSATVATGSSGLLINVAIGTAATTSGWRLGLGTNGSLQAIGTAGVLHTLAP